MDVFECIYTIFMVYFNVFIVCFNVFHYVWKYLSIFIDIVIGISPSYSHCNVFAIHTHLHICISLSTLTTFLTCYTSTLFSPISIDLFQLSYNLCYISILTFHVYTSPHIPHPTFHVITGCAEHSGAQVNFFNLLVSMTIKNVHGF
jgi:hypothetical protein